MTSRACASSAGPRSGGRSGSRRARPRRGSRPARRRGRASRRRRATRRRTPRRSPSSPAAGRRGTPWPARAPSPCSRSCRARRRRRRWSCRRPARWSAAGAALARVRSRNTLPPGMKISFCVGRSAPPDSTSEIVGRPFSSAIWAARKPFFTVHGLLAPPLHRRVVGGDQALDALDDADAGDQGGADREVGAPAGQRRELEERRALVDQQLDPLARQQLAAGVVAVDVLLPAAGRPPWRARRRGRRASPASPLGCGHASSDRLHPLQRGAHAPSRSCGRAAGRGRSQYALIGSEEPSLKYSVTSVPSPSGSSR